MKCYKGRLILQQEMEKVTYYSFLQEGSDYTETENFIQRFKDHELHGYDFNVIMAVIKEMGVKRGADIAYFRGESYGEALPPPYKSGSLRLYCGRYSHNIVILCNGGIKTSNLAQTSPDCQPHFDLMNALMKQINERVAEKMLREVNKKLEGNLHFEIGDCYE